MPAIRLCSSRATTMVKGNNQMEPGHKYQSSDRPCLPRLLQTKVRHRSVGSDPDRYYARHAQAPGKGGAELLPRCRRLALNVVCRDAAICLKLKDKPTLHGHRRSGVVAPSLTWALQGLCIARRSSKCLKRLPSDGDFGLMGLETCEPEGPPWQRIPYAPDHQPEAKNLHLLFAQGHGLRGSA